MISRRIAASAVAASLVLVPAQPVFADGDALVDGIIGRIIGGAIANEVNKGQRKATTRIRTRSSSASSGQSSAQRGANREVQTALNYFGYPVGTPDGWIGPKSRAVV